MTALLATVVDEGVPAMYDAGVTGLVVDDSSVCGVRVRQVAAADRFVQARSGVIIATGSFNLNPEMTKEHFPVVAEHGRPLGIDSNDGVGLRVAQTVGVSTRAMDGVIATSSIYPPEQLLFGIIVNADGDRFVAEDAYHGRTSYFIERQPNQVAYLIVDEAHFAYPDRGQDLVDAWDTVAEMEVALGIPAGAVEATLERYNMGVTDGEDHEFHKHSRWLAPLVPPLAAFDLSFASADYSFISLGGLRSDLDGRAIDADGNAVPGLYAVGAVAAHFPQSGAEYASGMSLGPGSFFGRRAGRHAAARRT